MDNEFDLVQWEHVKRKLKRLYPQLTDSDLIWRHETKNDLYNMIATGLGKTLKEFEDIIDSLDHKQNITKWK